MIQAHDLRDGLIFKAKRPRGNMHREFSIWKVGMLWMRMRMDFGEVGSRKDLESLLRFLQKYDFEVIGEWEVRYYSKSYVKDPFNLNGAL